jgi:hypothetical protein
MVIVIAKSMPKYNYLNYMDIFCLSSPIILFSGAILPISEEDNPVALHAFPRKENNSSPVFAQS